MWWLAGPLLLVAALVQVSVVPFVAGGRVHVDLVLVLVVCWVLVRGVQPALLWALLGGLCLDLLSDAPFGTAVLALSIVAYVCAVGIVPWLKATRVLAAVVAFGATFLYATILLFLLRAQQLASTTSGMMDWGPVILPIAGANAILAVPIYWVLGALTSRAPRQRLG